MKVFRKVTPGRQPRHRDPRGADPGRLRPRRRAVRWLEARRSTAADDGPAAGDAAAVPAHRQRRLGPGAGQRAQPVRRGRPARRRGRRRLRRPRPRASARRCARCTRAWPSTSRPRTRPAADRGELAAAMTGRLDAALERRTRARRSTPPALRATVRRRRRARRPGRPADPRRPAPRPDPAHRHRAGRSSTSRASRPSRWPSGVLPDSPWRDVAGMLRSLRLRRRGSSSGTLQRPATTTDAEQRAYRAAGVVRSATRTAFLVRVRRPRADRRRADPARARTSPTRPSTRPSTRPATARPG